MPFRENETKGPSVVHIIGHLDIGGGELFLLNLARALAARGLRQAVFAVSHSARLAPDFAAQGLPVRVFAKSSKLGLVTIARMARALRHFRPSVVQTHGEGGLFWGAPAAAVAGIDIVSLVYQNYRESALKVLAARTALRRSLTVVAGSQDVHRFCRNTLGVQSARLRTIPCGIVPQEFVPKPSTALSNPPRIVAVGRLVPRKGHLVLIEAFWHVLARYPSAELHLVGEGPERTRLERRAAQIGVERRVRFHDTIYPTNGILRQADVFAFPSIVEPQGLAILEAFASGVPVVAARTGGVVDMVCHEREGLLVPPGDVGELATALLRLLDDGPLRARLVAHAHERLHDFDVAGIAEAYLDVYERVVPGLAVPSTIAPAHVVERPST